MNVIAWSSIPMSGELSWFVIVVTCACIAGIGGWLCARAFFEKGIPKDAELVAEGVVGSKYVCHPRGGASEPVLMVSEKDWAAARRSKRSELMVAVTCTGGFAFAEWVTPKFFDSVDIGSKVEVRYVVDPKTQTRLCTSLTKKR